LLRRRIHGRLIVGIREHLPGYIWGGGWAGIIYQSCTMGI
jgi:hypothetical protein